MNYLPKTVRVFDIEWDTDGEEIDLPNSLELQIPDDITNEELEDYVSDQISNITGFCHFGFVIDREL